MRSSERCHFNQILIYSRLGADITDLFYLDVDRIAKDNEQFGAEVNYTDYYPSHVRVTGIPPMKRHLIDNEKIGSNTCDPRDIGVEKMIVASAIFATGYLELERELGDLCGRNGEHHVVLTAADETAVLVCQRVDLA